MSFLHFLAKKRNCYTVLSGFLLILAIVALTIGGCPIGFGQLSKQLWPANDSYAHYRMGGDFDGGMAVSPDGKLIVYSSPNSGHGDLYVASLDEWRIRQLTADPDCELQPVFSPDGRKIAYVREHAGASHLWLMDRDGENQRQVTFGDDDDSNAQFLPDSKTLVFERVKSGTNQITSYLIDVESLAVWPSEKLVIEPSYGRGGTVECSVRLPDEIWITAEGKTWQIAQGRIPIISPDGQLVAFASGTYDQNISIIPIKGSVAKVLNEDMGQKRNLAFLPDGHRIVFLNAVGNHADIQILDVDKKTIRPIVHIH